MKARTGGASEIQVGSANFYAKYCSSLMGALNKLEVMDRSGKRLGYDHAFTCWGEISRQIQTSSKRQFLCGNGASAAFANHMALDWSKNGRVRTQSFSDSTLLTALGNDWGGEEIFAGALRLYSQRDDLLVTISSSGNSPNILKAIATAHELGLRVVTLSGLRPDNHSRSLGELNFFIPAKTYGVVECAHQVLLHIWLDRFMGVAEWEFDTYQNMSDRLGPFETIEEALGSRHSTHA